MKKICLIFGLCAVVLSKAEAFETSARNAILVDFDTGTYLFAKNETEQIPPASMSKLMTVYILFDRLKSGILSLDDEWVVSKNAWSKGGAASGGSTMFLNIGQTVKVDDLLRGIIVQSGNDACIVAAENISGSEENFARLMNETASKLGLKNASFANATGLPDENQRMSVEDLAILARAIIKDFGDYYHIFQEKEFTYNKIKQGNRNPLLYSMEGADGLKTGHTEEAGFCLTGSVQKNGRRLIEVVAGLSSNQARSDEAKNLMNYGFQEFENYTLFNKGQVIGVVPVWYGNQATVDMTVSNDIVRTYHKNKADKYTFKMIYDTPIKAPIAKGTRVGQIKITSPDGQTEYINLVAAKDVAKVGIFKRILANLKYYWKGRQ
ncbi:MAG: D-alanyl-D-alanine carboxypeptidase [Alphaproteobacteria bacterium]|nr:D-alanyl-D-alanine carboxypeptidase [Alphaproteobacteria bacterium]